MLVSRLFPVLSFNRCDMLYRFAFSRSLLACACVLASAEVMAQSVNVTIQGEIQEVSCTPQLTGTGVSGNTITLPTVQVTDLGQTGKTAGDTTITFALSNCGMSLAKNNMWVSFYSSDVDGAGRISTNISGVRFEVRDVDSTGAMGNLIEIFAAPSTSGDFPAAWQGTAAAFTGSFPSSAATKSYIIRYYANQAVTQAGAVSTAATYTVKYY